MQALDQIIHDLDLRGQAAISAKLESLKERSIVANNLQEEQKLEVVKRIFLNMRLDELQTLEDNIILTYPKYNRYAALQS